MPMLNYLLTFITDLIRYVYDSYLGDRCSLSPPMITLVGLRIPIRSPYYFYVIVIDVKAMKRSGFEIQADILYQVKSGIDLPTRIMYAVRCSWQQICSCLDELVRQGLVDYSVPVGDMRKKKRYRITEKGEIALSCLSEVRRLVVVESVI
jgi:predicted transcriptional regulator